MEIAAAVAASGAVMLRGGAYKPRTSPYSFQGLGEEGLKYLREASDKYGLPIVTEIVDTSLVDVMEKYGLPYEERLGGLSMEDGYVAVDRLVAEGLEVDGVFAFNEAVGVGAMNHLRELGFRIPEDISVAAFSGTDLSKAVFPQLTSVEPPMFEMGCTAARMLIERVLDPATPVRTVILNAEINLRGSTGKK